MPALKYLQNHRSHDGGQTVAERALRQHHEVDQHQGRKELQRDQRREADRKTRAARGPDPFTPQPVGKVSEPYLAGNTEQTDQTQRPDRYAGAEADVEQIFGLVNLHCVPDVQSAEITERYPPEPRGADGAAEGPVDAGPIGIDDIGYRLAGRRRRGVSVRLKADVLGALAQQKVDRREHDQNQYADCLLYTSP